MDYIDFTKKVIHIFTLVTGPYTNYFLRFYDTIGNLFPDNYKVLHIASDGLMSYNGKYDIEKRVIGIDVKHIIDLPFPLIPIQKTYMQKNYITEDMDIILYFDIDTWFPECEHHVWENLAKFMTEDNQIIMSRHPHHDFNDRLVWNLVEENPESKAYIPEEYNDHVISSFWGGTRENVLKMCDYVNAMFKYDLKNVRYLPKFVDENYINKLIWQTRNGQVNDLSFHYDEHLIYAPDEPSNYGAKVSNTLCIQKYDISIKNSKKIVE